MSSVTPNLDMEDNNKEEASAIKSTNASQAGPTVDEKTINRESSVTFKIPLDNGNVTTDQNNELLNADQTLIKDNGNLDNMNTNNITTSETHDTHTLSAQSLGAEVSGVIHTRASEGVRKLSEKVLFINQNCAQKDSRQPCRNTKNYSMT